MIAKDANKDNKIFKKLRLSFYYYNNNAVETIIKMNNNSY